MRTPVALALASLSLLSVLSLHCGGRVDSTTLPDCPTNLVGACPVEGTCKQTTTDCAGTHELACQCDGSKWICPELGAPQCANECANAAQGAACTTKNLSCPMPSPPLCKGAPTGGDMCLCDGSHFVCTITDDCMPPPTPVCPPANVVSSGGACSDPSGMLSCPGYVQCGDGSTADISCSCTGGHWYCESFADPCMTTMDGGSAPDGK